MSLLQIRNGSPQILQYLAEDLWHVSKLQGRRTLDWLLVLDRDLYAHSCASRFARVDVTIN